MTINTAAQRRYIARLRAESVMATRRSRFDLDRFQDDYFAPGGLAEALGSENADRVYRAFEIQTMVEDTGLPQMIDHHAGNAWYQLWNFAAQGYAPAHWKGDNRKLLCNVIMDYPRHLRGRLDAVFEGLRLEVDLTRSIEREFYRLEADWEQTMLAICGDTPGRYKERFQLMRQAAADAYPDLVEWFERLRYDVCDGGHTSAWLWGDEKRHVLDDTGD